MPNRYGMVRSERRDQVEKIVEPYLVAKKDRTMLSMQYNRIVPDPEGYITTVLSSIGTETTRLTSSESFVDPASTNLQNISKKMGFKDPLYRVRDCFIADPGFLLWALDYEKAEAVMAAAYSKDWDYYEKLLSGTDVHIWHAAHFFHHDSLEGVTKVQRTVAKMITYSSNYKITDRTLARKINKDSDLTGVRLTVEEAGRLKREYLDLHPLEDWWARVEQRLDDQGYIENAFGLKRYFMNPNKYDRLKEALAYLPQSTVACAINEALIAVYDALDEDGECELLLQVHDELMGQSRRERIVEDCLEIMDIMEEPFEIHGREVYIPVETAIGRRWGSHRKEDPEDNGRLREYSREELKELDL